jgi:hypothetical protein
VGGGLVVSSLNRDSKTYETANTTGFDQPARSHARAAGFRRRSVALVVQHGIATFDNDGTLWAEQPMYFQGIFIFNRIKQLVPQHPEWKTREPFTSVLEGDVKAALAGGEKALLEMAMAHTPA